jgi:hypothetical protein
MGHLMTGDPMRFLLLRTIGILLIAMGSLAAQDGSSFRVPGTFNDNYRAVYKHYMATHSGSYQIPQEYYASIMTELERRRSVLERCVTVAQADAALASLVKLRTEDHHDGGWIQYYPPCSYPFVTSFFDDNEALLGTMKANAEGRRRAVEAAAQEAARAREAERARLQAEADRKAAEELAVANRAQAEANLAKAKKAKTSDEKVALYMGTLELFPEDDRALKGLKGVINSTSDRKKLFRYLHEFGDKVLTDQERIAKASKYLPQLKGEYIRAGQHALSVMRTKAYMEAALRHTPSSQVRAAADRTVKYIQKNVVPAMQHFADTINDINYAASGTKTNGAMYIRDWGIQGGFYPSMILR